MDIEVPDGHGEATMAELAELNKALEIGYSQPASGMDSLRVESLESTLKLLTFSQTHTRMWNAIPKDQAYSTVEEYNRLSAYGSEGGGFVPSGELPEEEDSTYARADQKVKYLGTTRSVHHPATLVRSVPPDIIAQETSNGALWLMGKANSGLYYGDSDAVPVEFNSLTKQIIDGGGTVIDLKGTPLDQSDIENAAQYQVDNFGAPGRLFSNPKVFTDFGKAFQDKQRFPMPGASAPGMAGTPVIGHRTIAGDVMFEPDTFVKRGAAPAASASSQKAPNAPTLSLSASTTQSGSVFEAGDNGVYKWQVTAVNRYGESAPCTISSGVTIAAGEGVTLTITDGGGVWPATAYKIYRTEKDGSTTYYTHKIVPRATSGGSYINTTTYLDKNEWRPRCFIGLQLDMTPQSLTFKQLSPMIKMNLAIVSPALRWMQLMYGTPIVYNPLKNVVFKNIGVAA